MYKETLENERNIHATFSYGVIYVYSIPDDQHKGRLKIGGATLFSAFPTQEDINKAAHGRIQQQTKTADVPYVLEHAELSMGEEGNYFSDNDVHEILKRSGFDRKAENTKNSRAEWFEISLGIAKNAIQAAKEGRKSLSTIEKADTELSQFPFRPNQRDAIDKTISAIKQNRKHFLWNAKMRFGKTSAAMQVAKENEMKKVLIVTHRPSVSADWYDDFNRVFAGTNYEYASKTKGEHISKLTKGDIPFVYFASLQDLRLSKRVVSDEAAKSQAKGFDKNDEVFDTTWDILIIDEAHEGTQSNLGDTTFTKILVNFTLQLSGTPFNILYKHEEKDIYTWDYVMEQEEKLLWDERHPGVPNPYAELPSLSMFTYDIDQFASSIGSFGDNFHDALDGAFKFHEFFRVYKDDEGNDTTEFVHEAMVKKFLDLLVDNSSQTKFPYSSEEYRNYNKHSLWLLPNRVKVIEAMEKLLKDHAIFGSGNFGIVNISGDNQDDEQDKDAKDRVSKAIKNFDHTVTLTGQRLTTGASIPEWTAVFMMSDTSSATTYLQTAFRCQTPARIDGKLKTQGYVFDFAPDRTLRLVAEAIELNHKSGKTNTPEQKEAMKQFLNFCPILAADGGVMKPYDVGTMLVQLKKAIIERVSRNGFDDPKLYNDELLQLDEVDIEKFNNLKAIVGAATGEHINEITVNELGMDHLETIKAEEAERKKKKKEKLTPEQEEALKRLKEAREQKRNAVSILRAVSIRMPMLVYGANVSVREDVTLEKFIDIVDDESWKEFMPAGLTKDTFREFTKYYDEEVFRGVTRSIRAKAYDYDNLPPTERVQAIADIFSTFKNPDKETVLTPWDIVNQQMSLTLGGCDFRSIIRDKPEWKTHGEVSGMWTNGEVKILEINSKSGLYPLLAAYNIYSRKLIKQKQPEDKIHRHLWNTVLAKNIFVICKSPMAKTIAERTLSGYAKTQMNIVYIEDLINKIRHKNGYKSYNLSNELREKFNTKGSDLKFTAVIGNPPYQINTDTNFSTPVYHLFFDAAKSLHPDYISLIHPARFLFNAGATPKEWNERMLHDPHLSVPFYEPDSQKIFQGVDINGGICITFWDKTQNSGGLKGQFIPFKEIRTILEKVEGSSIVSIINPQTKTAEPIDESFPREVRIRPNYFEKFPDIFIKQKNEKHTVKIIGLEKGNKRTERYVALDQVDDSNLYKWKVFLPESNGSGALGEVASTPLVGEPVLGEPLMGCTGSFMQFGPFYSKSEAQNCMKYIKTKFCRVLLGTLKVTKHNTKATWKNVSIQDFAEESDIDWLLPVLDIDKQLYKKYGLSEEEVDFIETHVKAME